MNKLGTIGTLFTAAGMTICTAMPQSAVAEPLPELRPREPHIILVNNFNHKQQLQSLTAEEERRLNLSVQFANCIKVQKYKTCENQLDFNAQDMKDLNQHLRNKYKWQWGLLIKNYMHEHGLHW